MARPRLQVPPGQLPPRSTRQSWRPVPPPAESPPRSGDAHGRGSSVPTTPHNPGNDCRPRPTGTLPRRAPEMAELRPRRETRVPANSPRRESSARRAPAMLSIDLVLGSCDQVYGDGKLAIRAISQLRWSGKDREEWLSLRENHGKACRFGLHQFRNCSGPLPSHRSHHTNLEEPGQKIRANRKSPLSPTPLLASISPRETAPSSASSIWPRRPSTNRS